MPEISVNFNPPLVDPRPRDLNEIVQKKTRGKASRMLARDAILNKVIRKMVKDTPRIVDTIIQMAKDGDLQAAKLILDRVIPVHKPTDSQQSHQNKSINIIINGNGASIRQTEDIADAEFKESNDGL